MTPSTLGFGSTLILTSLVCLQVVVTLADFTAGAKDTLMTIQSIEEVLSSIRNERELEAVGGAGAPSALRMRRIRILEKITVKPFAYIERTTQPSTAKCKCSYKKDCSPRYVKKTFGEAGISTEEDLPGPAEFNGEQKREMFWSCQSRKELTGSFKDKEDDIAKKCNCDASPTTSVPLIPTAGNPKGAIRRFPMKKILIPLRDGEIDRNGPTPSQISIESVGPSVKLAPRRILYNFNQNGQVNITHIRGLSKYSTFMEPPARESPLTKYTTTTPRYQYHYVGGSTNSSKPVFYLSRLFVRRLRKVLGEKSHVTDKAYGIEKGLLQSTQEMVLIDRLAKGSGKEVYKGRRTKNGNSQHYNPWNGRIERIQGSNDGFTFFWILRHLAAFSVPTKESSQNFDLI